MKAVLELTSYKVDIPKPYGFFHLSFLIIGIISAIFLANKLKNISDKNHKRLLFGIGLFLLLIEIYKELFYYFIVNNNYYDWSIFPFQLCDVPVYICLIVPFIKNKRIEETIYNFMVSYNLLGGFLTLFEPSSIIRPYFSMTLHGFIWHIILVFLGLYLSFSGRCLKERKDFKVSVVMYLFFCLIALSLNLSLEKISKGMLNAFYLGPKISPIIVFSSIATKYGWFINMIIYILSITFGAYLVYNIMYSLIRRKMKYEN